MYGSPKASIDDLQSLVVGFKIIIGAIKGMRLRQQKDTIDCTPCLLEKLVLIHPHLHNHLSQTVQGASKRKLMVCCVRRWYELVYGLLVKFLADAVFCRKAQVLDSTSELQLGSGHRQLRKEIDRERKGVGSYVHSVNLVLWKVEFFGVCFITLPVILFEHQLETIKVPMRSHGKEQHNCCVSAKDDLDPFVLSIQNSTRICFSEIWPSCLYQNHVLINHFVDVKGFVPRS
ncbi:hypothetical protein MKW98_019968, partial [Papaver atlanticum]